MISNTSFVFTFLISIIASAQNADEPRLKVDSKKAIKLEYSNRSWNANPAAVDKATVYVRDANSGQILPFEMTEDSPNSGRFVGEQALPFANPSIVPEIYTTPKNVWGNPQADQVVNKMIQDGMIYRKAFFMKSPVSGVTSISTFDSKTQAYDAFEVYKKVVSAMEAEKAALAAQRAAQIEAEKQRLAELSAKAESDRMALEGLEKQRKAALAAQMDMLSAAAKAKQQQEAKAMADEAMKLYRAEKYAEAEKRFNRAFELDPSNNQIYYAYGVTLYKIGKYNPSIVALKLATGNDFDPVERAYYVALNMMKLKEVAEAQRVFDRVKSKNHKVLSPAASFFSGVIDFQKENYDRAKESFEYVLDNSSNPQMDNQAEAYIEQIANIKMFLARKAKRWTLSTNAGLMYDSNVLSASTASAPTNMAGWRWMYGFGLDYRMMFEEQRDWTASLGYSDMYSMSSSMGASPTFRTNDPQQISFYLPYKTKGTALGKPYQLTLSPGMETINMDADGNLARELILSSMVFKLNQVFVASEDWFTGYTIEARKDTSFLAVAEEENQTASKLVLTYSNIFFRDSKKATAYSLDLGLTSNIAAGVNQQYSRYDLGIGYSAPAFSESSWNAKLGYYSAAYAQHLTGRADTDISLGLGIRTPYSESMAGTWFANYIQNASTNDAYAYNKYMLLYQFSWSVNF